MFLDSFCKLSLAFFLSLLSHSLECSTYTPIADKAEVPILTPSLAQRETQKIRLDNGLEAFIISDPQADKSAVALTVKVGSWQEPADKPGLAHFLEHMLFMGTDKYPDENEFDQYVSDHGGNSDAFTANDMTGYIFDVDTTGLEGALDRYSRFFVAPRFNPSGVARELKAIDQEYAKNVENDHNREYHTLKELSSQDHPFQHFSMGNSQTLAKVSQNDLIEWYKSNYSSNIMRLVVISSLPLDTLRSLVVTYFSEIPNLELSTKPIYSTAVNPKNLAQIAYIEPIKNRRSLNIIWELSPKYVDLEAKPDAIFCTVLGDEGPHSLLAQLKKEGLADTITCGVLQTSEKVQQLFLEIGLTIEGVEHVDTVAERVFQTISRLKLEGILPYLYEDAQLLSKLSYQYQSRILPFDDAMLHAANQAYEPLSTYPVHTYVVQRFDPELAMDLLNYLTPANAYFQVIAPAALTGVEFDRQEKWLGSRYTLKPILEDWLVRWSGASPHPGILLPESNPYIPQKLALVNPQSEPAQPNPTPAALQSNTKGTIYFAPDTQFGLPEIVWQFYFKTPQVVPTPHKAALADLFARYVSDRLRASSYAASVAGLNFDLQADDYGLFLKISGYSEKAALLLKGILEEFKVESIDAERFERVKFLLRDEYADSLKEAPYLQGIIQMRSALYREYAKPSERGKALEKIDFEKFSKFYQSVFSKNYVEGLLYGNITEDEASSLVALLNEELPAGSFSKGKDMENAVIVLPVDQGPFYLSTTAGVQGNAAILTIENGPFSYKARGAQQICMQAMSTPFFNSLRTQQQTGYIVLNYSLDVIRELFSCFLVQSNTHDPRDLIARFELFLEDYLQELVKTNLSEERFNKIKASLITELQRPAKNQIEMADLLFKLAFKHKGDFQLVENRIDALKKLTYAECIEWALLQYGHGNKRRLAIGIKGKVPFDTTLDYQSLNSLKQLRKLSNYKQ